MRSTIVAEISGIQNAINSLVTNQADGQDALAAHLTAIETKFGSSGTTPRRPNSITSRTRSMPLPPRRPRAPRSCEP